jgi:AsmA protein
VRQGRKGWREEPIDLTNLRKADADIALALGRVTYKDVRLGPGTFTLALKGGFAQLTLDALELYGGRAQGLVTLDASGDVPVFGANLKLKDVAMLAFAGDALDFGWLDGRGDVALEIAGQGRSEREIVDALNGRLNLRVADGSMIGADVGKIVGNVQQGRFIGLSPSAGDRTPFSELAASLKIANGVATSRDMRLVSTHLNLDGEGTFALGERQMDCELRAKISGGKRGDGAGISVGSLELPVTIRGPWERPTYGIKGQEQLMEAVRTVGKRLKSPDVQDTIKGLLGSDKEERAKSRAKARELLENFLKKE